MEWQNVKETIERAYGKMSPSSYSADWFSAAWHVAGVNMEGYWIVDNEDETVSLVNREDIEDEVVIKEVISADYNEITPFLWKVAAILESKGF